MFVVAGLALLTVLGLPKSLHLFVVQTGSMKPTIKTGSLVIVRPEDNYQKDDAITFKAQSNSDIKNSKYLITHRINDIKEENGLTFYVIKGDANKTPDGDLRLKENVLGKVIFSVPYLGYPVGFAKTQTGFVILIVIPATIIIYSELMTIRREVYKLLEERKKRKLTLEEKIELEVGEEEIKVERWYHGLINKFFKKR